MGILNAPKKKPRHSKAINRSYEYLEQISFPNVTKVANSFAAHIEKNLDALINILLSYESYEVAQDETARTLDMLKNLRENERYFSLRVGSIAAFLPRNQPLYALTCFVIAPSLMSTDVHFRIPQVMRFFFPKMLKLLDFKKYFPNVHISYKERIDFLKERSALKVDSRGLESMPVTEAVIFTGIPIHAEQLRLAFDNRTLFIANGAGHNPIVIGDDANLGSSVEAVLTLQLYNQGQDCAAPNSILVHKNVFNTFIRVLHDELKKVRIGNYIDRSCRVGPISEPDDLIRIQKLLSENREWIDPLTPGIIRTVEVIVEPTVINKPLKYGGNYTEVFAPIIFLQKYEDDNELAIYFESPHYEQHAMYVSLYGSSKYIDHIVGRNINGKILHDRQSVLRNKHLHMLGVERGTQPYGGNGCFASSVSINQKRICKPTLPQRDIYELLVKPLLKSPKKIKIMKKLRQITTKIECRNVNKVLGIKHIFSSRDQTSFEHHYIDSFSIIKDKKNKRFVPVNTESLYKVLSEPNLKFIATLEPRDIKVVRSLRKFLHKKKIEPDDLTVFIFSLSKDPLSKKKDQKSQQRFFRNLYQLLLGKDSGPRLTQFLLDVDKATVMSLLDV